MEKSSKNDRNIITVISHETTPTKSTRKTNILKEKEITQKLFWLFRRYNKGETKYEYSSQQYSSKQYSSQQYSSKQYSSQYSSQQYSSQQYSSQQYSS